MLLFIFVKKSQDTKELFNITFQYTQLIYYDSLVLVSIQRNSFVFLWIETTTIVINTKASAASNTK